MESHDLQLSGIKTEYIKFRVSINLDVKIWDHILRQVIRCKFLVFLGRQC